jgi:folate-binding protein YgfZ
MAAEHEYRALIEGAGVVELPGVGRLRARGSDRVDFLQGMLSNDVKRLAPGGGCPSLLLTEQGKVVADLIVLAEPESFALDGAASALVGARAALERYIVADDVELESEGEDARTFALLGPAAASVVERLGATVPPGAYDHAAADGGSVHVVRVPEPGAGGFLCRVSGVAVQAWRRRTIDAGAVPVGPEVYEVLRIESGRPAFGQDVGPETLALEAPYEAAISFRKGCYLGQEVMERVTARGHVNRKLVGLELSDRPVPGARLHAGGRDVGWLTSVAWSWRLERWIALGYVRRELLAPGTTLAVGGDDGPAATVRALPF